MYASFSLLALLPVVLGKTTDVAVGQNGLTFTPDKVVAEVGDKVNFHFFPKNHSVVQSSFQQPCVPLDNAIFSGFQPTMGESPNVFEVTVTDTKPIWIYCAQMKHCQSGMSMVINEPKEPNTLAAYQAAAKSVSASSAPANVNGGVIVNSTGSAPSSNGTYTAGTPPSSTSSGSPGSASSPAAFTGAANGVGSLIQVSAVLLVSTGLMLAQL